MQIDGWMAFQLYIVDGGAKMWLNDKVNHTSEKSWILCRKNILHRSLITKF